jgi:hypothetical protein
MKCHLCKKVIVNYNITFNHLVLDKDQSADICSDCVDKFAKWQSSIAATLFPTKTMKKMYCKKE